MSSLQLTQEMIDAARRPIGKEAPGKPHWAQVTPDTIRLFAMGMGDDNPLYTDEAYGASAVTEGMVAPPLFLATAFMTPLLFASDSSIRSSGSGMPGMQGIYAACRFHFDRHIRPGEQVSSKRVRTGVIDVFNRVEGDSFAPEEDVQRAMQCAIDVNPADGGPLVIVAERHQAFADGGELLGTYEEYLARLEPERVEPSEGKFGAVKERRYTPEEMDSIEEQYGREAAARRGMEPRYWDDVEVGEKLPSLIKGPLTVLSISAWTAGHAGWFQLTDRVLYNFASRFGLAVKRDPDTNIWTVPEEMHWHPYVARLLSMPLPFDIASQRTNWLSHIVTDWMGDAGRMTDLDLWYHRPLFLSETMWINAKIVKKAEHSASEGSVVVEIDSETFDGDSLTTGSATVLLPRRRIGTS